VSADAGEMMLVMMMMVVVTKVMIYHADGDDGDSDGTFLFPCGHRSR
jgi:hypothetical protein